MLNSVLKRRSSASNPPPTGPSRKRATSRTLLLEKQLEVGAGTPIAVSGSRERRAPHVDLEPLDPAPPGRARTRGRCAQGASVEPLVRALAGRGPGTGRRDRRGRCRARDRDRDPPTAGPRDPAYAC